MRNMTLAALATATLLLTGCSTGTWTLETWGEEYIEEGIPGAEFEDGCEVVFDEFLLVLSNPALRDGDGQPVAELPLSQLFDLTLPGPHEVGSDEVPATTYDRFTVQVAPVVEQTTAGNATDDQVAMMDGLSILVAGTLGCGADEVEFQWAYQTGTIYECEPELTIGDGGVAETEFTVHGDHLFYDGLENEDARLRGRAIVDADTDDNGLVTRTELDLVEVAPLGDYDVGSASDVLSLDDFVEYLTRTLGHVDGEGHCQVEG